MQELQVLNVNNVDYEIADGKARTDITLTTESEQIGG